MSGFNWTFWFLKFPRQILYLVRVRIWVYILSDLYHNNDNMTSILLSVSNEEEEDLNCFQQKTGSFVVFYLFHDLITIMEKRKTQENVKENAVSRPSSRYNYFSLTNGKICHQVTYCCPV